MEQVYYTQCPIGYGLGASNGFQVKRASPGYPLTGDFRHLGMRAFLPGSRSLASPVLRYRRADDGAAELAWLVPRTHEYETERGLWGRPGGHFAHGVRLDEAELAAIDHWPAGLYGGSFWTTTDPTPSLGAEPAPVAFGPSCLRAEPGFDAAVRLAQGRSVEELAALWTALGAALQDGRSVVVVDRADRLGDLFGLLTLGLPARWRAAATFSTYHDRPEEFSGLRLVGTAPEVRLNRVAVGSMGVTADLVAGRFEPPVEPARWALALAGWVTRGTADDRRRWDQLHRIAASVRTPESVSLNDAWDRLFALPDQLRPNPPRPSSDADWRTLRDLTAWAVTSGLGGELAAIRGADWWEAHAGKTEDARAALVEHFRTGDPTFGPAAAAWLERTTTERRAGFLAALLGSAPQAVRTDLARSILLACSPATAHEGLRWLRRQPGIDPSLILPLEAREAAAKVAAEGVVDPLLDVLGRAAGSERTLIDVLDVVATATRGHAAASIAAQRAASQLLGKAGDRTVRPLLRWVMRQADPAAWLGPFARAVFATEDATERWAGMYERVPPDRQPAFVAMTLDLAAAEPASGGFFGWAVECLLLPLTKAVRPHNPRWPGVYLDRTPSGLDLIRRLVGKDYRDRGVPRWIDKARERGELSAAQTERIDRCLRFARALQDGDARALLRLDLPDVPPASRGELLAQIFRRVGPSDEATGLALDSVRAAWPDGFAPGADGLAGLAAAIADRIAAPGLATEEFFRRLEAVVHRLGLQADGGYEPDGLASEVVAAAHHSSRAGDAPWAVRAYLLRHDRAWRALAADVGRDAAHDALDNFDRWDRRLAKGVYTSRFYELWLNQSDASTLAALVETRAHELRTLGPLRWWNHPAFVGSVDDLRDAFARLAPMAPLDEEHYTAVRAWMTAVKPAPRLDDLAPLPVDDEEPDGSHLSDAGEARWRCIAALSAFHRPGLEGEACWQIVEGWTRDRDVPLAALEPSERYLFLAWLIPRLTAGDAPHVARLANWLLRHGMTDPDRLNGWADELARQTEVPDRLRLSQAPLVAELRAEWRTLLREAKERGAGARESGFARPGGFG